MKNYRPNRHNNTSVAASFESKQINWHHNAQVSSYSENHNKTINLKFIRYCQLMPIPPDVSYETQMSIFTHCSPTTHKTYAHVSSQLWNSCFNLWYHYLSLMYIPGLAPEEGPSFFLFQACLKAGYELMCSGLTVIQRFSTRGQWTPSGRSCNCKGSMGKKKKDPSIFIEIAWFYSNVTETFILLNYRE